MCSIMIDVTIIQSVFINKHSKQSCNSQFFGNVVCTSFSLIYLQLEQYSYGILTTLEMKNQNDELIMKKVKMEKKTNKVENRPRKNQKRREKIQKEEKIHQTGKRSDVSVEKTSRNY